MPNILKNSPLHVKNNSLEMGNVILEGTKWGAYFIFPRTDSDVASVGVVTATGKGGMKAAYANHYLVNGTTFPDVMIFDEDFLSNGLQSIKCAGFWSNEWSYDGGDFVWK